MIYLKKNWFYLSSNVNQFFILFYVGVNKCVVTYYITMLMLGCSISYQFIGLFFNWGNSIVVIICR
jgi:hypothetical protein